MWQNPPTSCSMRHLDKKHPKFIKCYLNRTHALRARGSDPDVAVDLMNTLGDQQPDEEKHDDMEEDSKVDCYQRLSALLRISNTMNVVSYLDSNCYNPYGT